MADLAAFRGILFDPSRVDLAKVLAPPYDVIDPDERARLAAADPHNVVRLILPEATGGDAGGDAYAAAARTLTAWLASGVLRRDDRRAVYRYQQAFTHPDLGDRELVRTGFIAAIRLQPFAERVVLPHERTLRAPREDRLALMTATSAHLSQPFALYRDPAGEVERLLRKHERDAPVFDVRLPDGVRHTLWRIADAETIGALRHVMAPRKLYLADGHHRYETMVALRDRLAARGELAPYSAAQYGTMFLCPMDHQGLVTLATHRVLHSVDGFTGAGLLDRLRGTFAVDRIDGGATSPAAIRAALADAPGHQPALAVAFPGEPHAWRLTLEPSANARALARASKATGLLDVSLLHGLILEEALGITPAQQEAQAHLRYVKDTGVALAQLGAPGTQAVFVLSPIGVDVVRQVADAGEVMPQKSTYFFPKLASGVVMNRVDPDEDLV